MVPNGYKEMSFLKMSSLFPSIEVYKERLRYISVGGRQNV